jgi:hypothetical protein
MPECDSDCQKPGSFFEFVSAASLVQNILGENEHQILAELCSEFQKVYHLVMTINELYFSMA